MPHHKKPRLGGSAAETAVAHNAAATANELSGDVVAIIFGCFPPEDIMRMRRVCKKWREAAKKAIVPPVVFGVDSLDKYNAMAAMTTALPNLQQLSILRPSYLHKYIDGEDPDELVAAEIANYTPHDVNIISNFRKLHSLHIETVYLNGRYPVLFDFPLLRELRVTSSDYLKFDLGMLSAGFPLLKTLNVTFTDNLTGDLRSLRVLKDTLEKLEIVGCPRVEGDFMDLADFPRLNELNLRWTATTGDMRDIGKDDFHALENVALPYTVIGGMDYKFHRIADVPSFMQAIHLLLQRNPPLLENIHWQLSRGSPDWYEYSEYIETPNPPLYLQLIQAGSRRGWSWYGSDPWSPRDKRHSCEINWLGPEPSNESSDYEAYIEEMQYIEQRIGIDFYRGYHHPPNEEQYRRLCEELLQRE